MQNWRYIYCFYKGEQQNLFSIVLELIEFYEVENSTFLVGLELTTPRLHAEWSHRWAMEVWKVQFKVWVTGSGDIDIFL